MPEHEESSGPEWPTKGVDWKAAAIDQIAKSERRGDAPTIAHQSARIQLALVYSVLHLADVIERG